MIMSCSLITLKEFHSLIKPLISLMGLMKLEEYKDQAHLCKEQLKRSLHSQ